MNAHVLPQPFSVPSFCFTRHSLSFFRPTKAMPAKESDASAGADIERQLMVLLSQITTARRATESEVAQINLLTSMTAAQQDAPHQPLPETAEPQQAEEADADSPHAPLPLTTHIQTSTASDQSPQQSSFYLQPPHLKRQPHNQPDHQPQSTHDSPPNTNALPLPEHSHISDDHHQPQPHRELDRQVSSLM